MDTAESKVLYAALDNNYADVVRRLKDFNKTELNALAYVCEQINEYCQDEYERREADEDSAL